MDLMSNNFSTGRRIVAGFVLLAISMGVNRNHASAQDVDVREQPIKWIKPGTVIKKGSATGWSHLVFAAYPRIGAGDVGDVGANVKNIAKKFTIACVGQVEGSGEGGKAPYRLVDWRIGLGTIIDGKNTIISSDKQLNADLGLIEGQVLRQTEKDFKSGIIQIVRTPTMCVYDCKAIILINDQPTDMFIRYVILARESDGRLATLTWLFDDTYKLHNTPMQYLPAGFNEDRVMSVDAEKFFLGIPQKGAIAQVKMAGSNPIQFTPALKVLAAKKRYKAAEAKKLEAELWKLWAPPAKK